MLAAFPDAVPVLVEGPWDAIATAATDYGPSPRPPEPRVSPLRRNSGRPLGTQV